MLRPESETELSDIIRTAKGPLVIRGGGTRGLAGAGEVLETGGLSGVTLYEPGALTMVARTGTPLADIEAALAAEGQLLAFEPPVLAGLTGADGASTIGGVFATNASGPRRVQVGAARDHLLGVRFVDGAGTVIKNGGRVMKNVTGYDLVKLLAGSFGTLGVLSEVSFKVLPRPDAQATLAVAVSEPAGAVATLSAALGSPFGVNGAAWNPAVGAVVRIEGFSDSVEYRKGRLLNLLAPFGPVSEVADDWAAIRDVAGFHGLPGDVWRLSVKPSDAPDLVAQLRQTGATEILLDWGGGLVWALAPEGTNLRPTLTSGHATLVRASLETRARIPTFQPEPPALAAISRGIRTKFDPRGILNPGLMG